MWSRHEKWISYPNKNLDDHPTIKKMYVKYNTILASQASVERIFSFAKLVLGLRRGSLGDENFEKQLVMKANRVMNPKLFQKKNNLRYLVFLFFMENIEYKYLNIDILGCHFNFCKALWKRVQT